MSAFSAPYLQRALVEVLLLAVLAGVLGTWIVLRRLAFFTHAVGTATFPGLVAAAAWGLPAPLAALACAAGFGGVLERLARSERVDTDVATGLLLVGALALGAVLASDVLGAGAGVDRLLFGSLIALRASDLWLTAGAVALVVGADALARRAWLAGGFDPGAARALGIRTSRADRLLLLAVAVAVVVALNAVGALLVTVVFVVPAATVRLLDLPPARHQLLAGLLAAAEGFAALVLADAADVGPGPALAVISGAVLVLVAAATRFGPGAAA
jgi:manganese/iron transport system permease protein